MKSICSPPTAFCLLPTAYCRLPTAYCLLPTSFEGGGMERALRRQSRTRCHRRHGKKKPASLKSEGTRREYL
jgi:hypothetical protein